MVSGQSFGSSAVSLACITSMCSVQCFRGGHSLRLAFGSFFYPHPSPPLNSSTVKSVWRVPGSIGVGAHGWRARVCQPWGRNCLGLAVPKVEAPGHSGHPPLWALGWDLLAFTALVVLLGWDPWGVYCVSSVYEAFGLTSFLFLFVFVLFFCGVA